MRVRILRARAACLALCLLGASPAPADEADDRERVALDLEQPPLMALPLGEAPGATTVITAEEIARSGAANIFELLRRVPGVDIRYTPMGGHIGIRSTGASPFSEQVLLLIDGAPYNSPDKGGFPGHPNYSGFFPLDRIARIEIIKGPISVLYGANAFGGVINIVSKKAADAVTDSVEGSSYGATLAAGGRSLLERSVRAAGVRRGWEAALEGGAQDGDTHIRANGDADHGREYVYGALGRGNLQTSVLHQESRHGSFLFDGAMTRTARNSVDIVDARYERRLARFVLRGSATLNRYRGTTCAECHNSLSLEPDDAVTSDVGEEIEVDQRVRAALRVDHDLTDRQQINFGVEAARDTIDRDIVRLASAPSSRSSNGVYLQHQWRFGARPFHLLTGVRQDRAQGLGKAASPRLALVVEPSADLTLRASWSRAFRAPTWNERYIRQRFLPLPVAPSLIVVLQGNPGLDRERVDAAEAGLSWRAARSVVLKLDLYNNRVRSFIERGPGSFVPGAPNEIRHIYQNRAGEFTLRGFELTLAAHPHRAVSFTAAYGHRHLTLDADDPAAAYAPRSRGIVTVAWNPGRRWTADLAASHSSGYTVSLPDVFGPRPQPAYEIVDAAVRYTLPFERTSFKFGLVGRNLTDARPYETLVGPGIDTSLRGRTIALELQADF
jgi:outer membrane receptor protein involved in Fe transport